MNDCVQSFRILKRNFFQLLQYSVQQYIYFHYLNRIEPLNKYSIEVLLWNNEQTFEITTIHIASHSSIISLFTFKTTKKKIREKINKHRDKLNRNETTAI